MSTKRSYLSRSATQPLHGETIGGFLDRTVAQHGDREALVSRHQGKRYTYRQLDAEVARWKRITGSREAKIVVRKSRDEEARQ